MPEFPLPGALDGERLDRSVALVTGLSRSHVDGLIAAGGVRVDGRTVTSRSRRVRAGETISLDELPAPRAPDIPAGDPTVAIDVVWSDDDVVVVDKPAGLVVHPGAGHRTGTLVQGLLAIFPDMATAGGGEEGRPGIVHRLDKGTSGLLVAARSPVARASLVEQMRARAVRREYLALVAGTVPADTGIVDAPVGRSERDPTTMALRTSGRPARTRYGVEKRFDRPAATLLRCGLETGRTHQIRVHMASIGHPVVGDRPYGWRPASEWRPLPAGRHFLHAALLEFRHPMTGELVTFRSDLPPDLAAVIDDLTPIGPGADCASSGEL